MRVYRSIASLRTAAAGRRRVAAIGSFDGLHLGHQAIVAGAIDKARALDEWACVMSFEPTPAEFFAPDEPPARLTCFRERVEILRTLGPDEFFCPRFETLRSWSAERFVDELLVRDMQISHLVVGDDFRFGAGRRGTTEWLQDYGPQHGLEVLSVPPVTAAGERISSTGIRAALADGELDQAREMLGRAYSMSGRVVYGKGLGRKLGFPTANVNLKRRLAPVHGIYAVQVLGLAGEPLGGVASVGSRPTVGGGETLLEVFIFDFDEDIYGEYITVRFLDRLRDEKKFPDLESMQRQMHDDVAFAQAALQQRIA